METDDEESDYYFTQIAQKKGGIDPLLRSFFSFLHRKTDFYVEYGPNDPAAKMVFDSYSFNT